MKIYAPAKINLCLDILKKSRSGYHEISTILQEIPDLRNELEIKEIRQTKNKSTNLDLAHRAYTLLKSSYKIDQSLSIKIKRNIPIGSGLGGESSNAAAVLKYLNKFWNLKLSQKKLMELAAKLGMDVPFFILGGTALATHYGEKIKPLSPIKNIKFKIINRASEDLNKTKNAYEKINLKKCGLQIGTTKKLLAAIKKNDKTGILKNLHNDFETIFPVKNGEHLSGSGPSTFIAN